MFFAGEADELPLKGFGDGYEEAFLNNAGGVGEPGNSPLRLVTESSPPEDVVTAVPKELLIDAGIVLKLNNPPLDFVVAFSPVAEEGFGDAAPKPNQIGAIASETSVL
jgi:hypothetical protein